MTLFLLLILTLFTPRPDNSYTIQAGADRYRRIEVVIEAQSFEEALTKFRLLYPHREVRTIARRSYGECVMYDREPGK